MSRLAIEMMEMHWNIIIVIIFIIIIIIMNDNFSLP